MDNETKKNKHSKNNKNNKKKKKKKMKPWKKVILTVLLVLLVTVLSVSGYVYYKYGEPLGEVIKIAKDVKNNTIKVEKPINVLFLGLDIGDVKHKNNYDIKRTDTMILGHYNPSTEKCELVSIPRDTLIKYKGKNQKINVAYQLGGEKYVKQLVKDMTGVDVDYIVKIDYEGFNKVIDVIGGVDMEIEQDMLYDDWEQDLHINFKKGETAHLDGKKAEEYFRWRKNNNGVNLPNGDLDRIKNQQKLMKKVVDKLMSPAIITKIDDLIKVASDYVDTDMDLQTMVSYGMTFVSTSNIQIGMHTLEGKPEKIDNLSYLVYDKKANDKILSLINDNQNQTDGVSKSNIRIKIVNCTKINGLAAGLEQELKTKGYEYIKTETGQERESSQIQIKDEKFRSLIKNDVNITSTTNVFEGGNDYDVVIMLGKDYKSLGAKK